MDNPLGNEKKASLLTIKLAEVDLQLETTALDNRIGDIEWDIKDNHIMCKESGRSIAKMRKKISDLEDTVALLVGQVEELEAGRDEADHGGEPTEYVTHGDVECIVEENTEDFMTDSDVRAIFEEMLQEVTITIG